VIDVTRITHTNVNGVNGAILQCYAVHHALKLNAALASLGASPSSPLDPDEFLDHLQTTMESLEPSSANRTDEEKMDFSE